MNPQVLVYQAYGKEAILQEALFSIYSFLEKADYQSVTIYIYTDQIPYLQSRIPSRTQVVFELLSDSQKHLWQGKYQFVHRLKIEILKDLAQKLSTNTAILYVDTDTVFKKNPQVLFDKIHHGIFLMHTAEGLLASEKNPILKKTHRFLGAKQFDVQSQKVSIPSQTMMYNAGVLGFLVKNSFLLDSVLALTDAIYPQFGKHIVEQLAFSFYFQQYPLETAYEEILHYWNFKEFRNVLKDFFQHYQGVPAEELQKLSQHLSVEELHKPKLLYERQSSLWRAWKKLTHNTWKLPDYKFWEK